MRARTRLAAVAALAAALLAGGAVALTPRPTAPVVPAARAVERAGTIDGLRERLQRLPGDWMSWAALGFAYVEQSRTSGDPGSYGRAEEALSRSLAVRPEGNAYALAGLSALAAARHDFALALQRGQAAAAADPYSATAHGVVCDALVELGRYDEATAAAQRMVDLRPDTGAYARASYLLELRGSVPAAQEAMQLALRSAPTPPDAAFARQHLAQLAFDSGDLDAASSHVDEGLRVMPGYPALLALRAKILAARGDLAGAAEQLRAVVVRLPVPEHAAALAEVLTVLADPAGAAAQHALVQAGAGLLRAAGVSTDLELVAYHADRAVLDGVPLPASFADTARAAYGARPSITAADALAWALHAAGRDVEALSYADSALRLGTRNALYHYHRGMIRLATGDLPGARTDLDTALRINPYFSIRHAPIARRMLDGLP